MITLIAAAVAAAQPAPPASAQSHSMPMQHEQHEAMKDDCCCKDMAAHKDGHGSEHSEHGAQ